MWSALFKVGTRLLPTVARATSLVVSNLVKDATSALGSLRIEKVFGKGNQISSYLISSPYLLLTF